MLFRTISVLLASSVLVSLSAAEAVTKKRHVPSSHVLHERQLEHLSARWEKRERVSGRTLLPMRIGLKQDSLERGHEMLMDISDPESPNFGKYLSAEEVNNLFAPSASRVGSVINWLTSSGISADRISQSTNKQWIQFDAHADEVEDLLHTDFYVYEHSETGSRDMACGEYHLPSNIVKHVDYITPGIRLREDPRQVRKMKQRKRDVATDLTGFRGQNTGATPLPDVWTKPLASGESQFNSSVCDTYITNVCIRNQYRLPKGTLNATGNELGIFESLNDHVVPSDLDLYWKNQYPDIPLGTYPSEESIDGAHGIAVTVSEEGIESNLDFMAAMPIIWPQKTILFQTDDEYYEISQGSSNEYLGFWNTFYDALDGSYCTYSAYGETGNCETDECRDPAYPDSFGYSGNLQCGVYKPTNVISISYGGYEVNLPASYLKRQCSEIMKLGLQGTTVVISSGDSGVGPDLCIGDRYQIFAPGTDAVCPYVLSVGSTEFDTPTNPNSCKLDEVATTRFYSGGGFSNYFGTPDYQYDAVQSYLTNTDLGFTGYTNATFESVGGDYNAIPDGYFNLNGRGYPDVSAIGDRFVMYIGGVLKSVGGTSLSAPVWASILTRINEERLAVGKSTVGFINPTLYANPQVFTDVTEGSNPGCADALGFVASAGWDPVTGLGSPNYPKLLSLFMSLP